MKFRKIEKSVGDYVEKNRLIKTGEKILVAVSGGPDSIFLLHILNSYRKEFGIDLICCHINHNLRGDASKRDESFVKDVSQKMDMPFVVRNLDVSSYRENEHLSLEDAARQLRLKTLNEIAEKTNSQKVALGHTFDDLIETFFLNILRGSGRGGLLGMRAERDVFIRPLLCLTKAEIILYLKERDIDYRIDVTNWHSNYRRNFIRRELVPVIEEKLNKGAKRNIARLMTVLKDEEEIISRIVEREMGLIVRQTEEDYLIEREGFRGLEPAIQRRVIMRCFEDMEEDYRRLNFSEIESLRNAISGRSSGLKVQHYGVTFYVGTETVLVQKKRMALDECEMDRAEEKVINIPGEVKFQNRYYIKTSVLGSINGDISNPDCVYFNLDEIEPPILLRTRSNGDKFRPFGMKNEKKVKDFFIDSKIPFWERDKIPIIADAKNILWIVDLRRSDMAKVGDKTKRILKIEKREIG